MNQKLVEKAKTAHSAAELRTIVRQEGIALSEKDAEKYYAQLHSESGEISDSELANVAGGGCESSETLAKSYRRCSRNSTCDKFDPDYGARFSSAEDGHTCVNCTHAITSSSHEYFCEVARV